MKRGWTFAPPAPHLSLCNCRCGAPHLAAPRPPMHRNLLHAIPDDHSTPDSAPGANWRSTKFVEARHNKQFHVHDLSASEKSKMASYEGLDYMEPQNVLHKIRQHEYSKTELSERNGIGWILYLIIGFGTGFTAFIIAIGVETLIDIRFGVVLKLMGEGEVFKAWLADVFLACWFVMVATLLVVRQRLRRRACGTAISASVLRTYSKMHLAWARHKTSSSSSAPQNLHRGMR